MNTTIIIITAIAAVTTLTYKFISIYGEFKKDNTINKYYDARRDIRGIENIVVKNIEQNDKYNNTENEKRYMYSLSNDEMRKILDDINNICKKWD